MPNVTLITGGPRSGKTEALVGRLAGLYNDNPFGQAVALVPTVRHGDQFRRRLVERCGVALGLRVEIISQFSLGLVSGAWMPSYALVGELLTRTIRSQVESGPAVYFRPISGTKGLSNLVRSAVAYLLSEVIAPQALSEASSRAGSDSLVALSAIYAAYANDLEQREWVHPAQIGLTAARVVRADAELPAVIVLDGFHLFRGAELVLLQALAERADVTISLDPDASARSAHDYQRLLRLFPNVEVVDLERGANGASSNVLARDAGDREGQLRLLPEADSPEPLGHGSDDSRTVIARETSDRGGQLRLFPDTEPVETQGHRTNDPPTVIAGEAADREGQLRAMARQIKQRLTEQPTLRPSDCAVSFRQASPYLGLARQIFAEYNLPLDPAAGERLNSRPLGVWLRRLLHLREDGWRVREVAAVLLVHVGLARLQFVARVALADQPALVRTRLYHQRAVVLVHVDHGDPRRHAVRQVVLVLVQGMLRALEEVHGLDRLRFVFEAVGKRPVQPLVDQEPQRDRVVEVLIERALAVVLLLPEAVELFLPGAQIVHVPDELPALLGREHTLQNHVAVPLIAIPLFLRKTRVRSMQGFH